METKVTFTIDKKVWFRDSLDHRMFGKSSLLNPNGKRCCVGIMAGQCNVPDECLLNRGTLASVPDFETFSDLAIFLEEQEYTLGHLPIKESPKEQEYAFGHSIKEAPKVKIRGHARWLFSAYVINDNPDLTDQEKIDQLTEMFDKQGITLVFVD